MKASVKIFTTEPKTDFGFPIKLIITHKGKTRRRTISHSKKIDWDPTSDLPKLSHPDFEAVYSEILEIRKKSVKMEFRNLIDIKKAFEYFLGSEKKEVPNFYDFADQQIQFMENSDRHGNAAAYAEIKKELQKFAATLSFEQITPQFLENFKSHKKESGVKNVTIRKYIGEIRAIYNTAVKAGATENKNPFLGIMKDIPVRKRRARNRYFSEKTLRDLEKLDLPEKSYQRAIDFSLLQFYLCGVDLIDIYYLKKTDLTEKRVFFSRRRKLGAKGYEFDVCLPDRAKKIIEKYRDDDPENDYLFHWRKSWTGYKTFRDNHNRNLRILQNRLKIELEPKNDNFSTKVMRHTFATLGKFARIEEDLLRELMGHERNDVDTIYKDKYPEAERDEAQLKIIGLEPIP